MRIECAYTKLEKVENLKPHPSNRNKHSEKQIQALAKIIGRNGQRSPIVVSNLSGFITKGHGRLEAIKLLGWEECAVDYQNYTDEVEELRDRIADNEIARYSEFDHVGFLEDIKELDLELEGLDFEEFGKIDFKFIEEEKEEKEEKEDLSEKIKESFELIIEFKNELELESSFMKFSEEGYKCRTLIL